MAIVKKLAKRGFTLIELMIVVVIIGVLAAMALYGVRRYVANAKSAEARQTLGRISKDALTVFEGEVMGGTNMDLGTSRASSNVLCDSAGNSVPSAQSAIQGSKYQSRPTEWQTGSQTVGWSCLKTSLVDPQYYMYSYIAAGTLSPAASGDSYTAVANGDLDGDGTNLSTFRMTGRVQQQSGKLVLTAAPTVEEINPED